jgi:hypothetical protein
MIEGSGAAGHHQFRLGDLVVVVVGAAFVLDVTRRSRGAWPGVWPGFEHAPGLVSLTMAVALGLVVAIRGVRRLRAGEVGAWGLAWRLAALAWLAWSALEISSALQVRPDDITTMIPRDLAHVRLRLYPLMIALGLVGLVLALAPIRPRARATARPRVGSWPSVTLAGLAGLAFLTANGVIPYLVLLAVEFVSNAMRMAPLVARPWVIDRLNRVGLETLPGLLGCVATASWIDDDLRVAARDPSAARAPRSMMGVVARVATVGLAVGGAAYAWLVSLPRLHPNLAEGWGMILDSAMAPMVALGFASLAAGFAARSAAHLATGPPVAIEEAPRPFDPWPRRIFGWLACLVAMTAIAAAVESIRGGVDEVWFIPAPLYRWSQFFLAPLSSLGVPGPTGGWALEAERPGDLLFLAATAWIVVWLVVLLAGDRQGRPAPLDAIAGDRLAFGRFLGWWLGLTTVILASMPLLALAALALTHQAVRWLR